MRPANIFQMELWANLTDPARLLRRLGLALLLGLPFVLVDMPPRVKASGLVMLLIFVAFFGAAVGTVRAGTEGRWNRLQLLPVPRWLTVTDLCLAHLVLDGIRMGLLLVLYLAVNRRLGLWETATVMTNLTAAALGLGAAGLALGRLLKGNPDVHLAGGLIAGLLAAASGLFPLPGPLAGLVQGLEPFNPLAKLAGYLTVFGNPAVCPTWMAPAWPGRIFMLLVAALLLARFFNYPNLAPRRPPASDRGPGSLFTKGE